VAKKVRVVIEEGPKGKRFVAWAPDWPGLERGAKTPEAAVESLQEYIPRYVPVAKLAKLDAELAGATVMDVVERYPGTGSTDFWGISFAYSSVDSLALSHEQLTREIALMRACWRRFDVVRHRVSAEMRKGPRGGGRDRDRIVRHTLATVQEWARKVGVTTPSGDVIVDADGLKAYRAAHCRAITSFNSEGKMARTWPLRFLIRHTAFHTMDHTWEMEDKNVKMGET